MLAREALAYHTHQHLDVYVNGSKVVVPQGIGIDQAEGFLTVLHTHQYDGVIHLESPVRKAYTLGQFFGVWGVRLDERCLGAYCVRGPQRLRAFVNGQAVSSNPAAIPLRANDQIVVTFGTSSQLPEPIPSSYRFPPDG
jgi:hypothetical protein